MVRITKRNNRNASGVKDSANLYRTFGGAHYMAWVICPTEELIKTYRENGIRCKRIKDDLFIHHADEDKAITLDKTTHTNNRGKLT